MDERTLSGAQSPSIWDYDNTSEPGMFFISHCPSLGSSLFLFLYCPPRWLLHPHNAKQPPFPLRPPVTSYYISLFISCVALPAIYIWLTCLFVFKEPLWRWWPGCLFFTILDSSTWGSCPYNTLNNSLLPEFMDIWINKWMNNPRNQRHKTRSPECRKIHVPLLTVLLNVALTSPSVWEFLVTRLSSKFQLPPPSPTERMPGRKITRYTG